MRCPNCEEGQLQDVHITDIAALKCPRCAYVVIHDDPEKIKRIREGKEPHGTS